LFPGTFDIHGRKLTWSAIGLPTRQDASRMVSIR
jgi:hypothetical protein